MTSRDRDPATIAVYVGLDLLGDWLMKLPFIRALRAAFPKAHITWLAGKGRTVFAGVLAPLTRGMIDEVIENAGIGTHWHELLRRPLPDRSFDLVLDTQRRVLTTLILKRLRHRVFVSGAADWLFSDIRPKRGWKKPAAMVDQILELVELSSGLPVDISAPMPGDEASEAEARRVLPAGPIYVGLMPGAGGRQKCWPLPNYVEMARLQIAAGRVPVFLVGPGEREWEAELKREIPEALFPLYDGSSVMLTLAVGRILAACVANDSGGGHLIAASGVKLLSLWGPSEPAKATPIGSRVTVMRAQQFGGVEMDTIPLNEVAAAVDRLLTE